ncbi:HD domain-containing protein [Candidatus Woesearchaeota archaeon]|nr:HD domain-containing protein [Candidatus Woesearchaeota archaeon]
MTELSQLKFFYKLKNVNRSNSVSERKESSAEHCWSCLVLADYLLKKIKQKLDAIKVYEMLMYHDLVEVETGDICISNVDGRKDKKESEQKALHKLKNKVPSLLQKKIVDLFSEFEEAKTPEAKFCKAIDALDAEIHEMDYKQDWKGWKEEFLRKNKEHLFDDFPEMKELFEETIKYARDNGYFNQ